MNLGGSAGAVRRGVVVVVVGTLTALAWPGTASAAHGASAAGAAGAAARRYVSTTGDDGAAGTARAPFRTIQRAVDTAPAGGSVLVYPGQYEPFTVTTAKVSVLPVAGQSEPVVVRGRPGVQDVIRVSAPQVVLRGLTVTGCVPAPSPPQGFEENGSSGVRVDDDADQVTLRELTVRDSHGTNGYGLPFGCYGVFVHNANYTQVLDSDISGNGAGVYFNGGGKGASIGRNTIHDNDVIIRNTPGGNDDFGGGALAFTNLTASPGPLVSHNVITGNAGPSSDYVADGGAIEIYNASNVRVLHNTLANNENILETGTGPGGSCTNNQFAGNQVTGRTAGSRLDKSIGIILRCAQNMVINSNTFTEIDWWVYTIDTGDQFSSGVRGLSITNNTLTQWQKVYHLAVDPVANGIRVDKNRFHFTGPIFSSYGDGTTGPGLAEWRVRSGLDQHSTTF